MDKTDKTEKNKGVIKEFQEIVDSTSDFLKKMFPLVYNFTTMMREKLKRKKEG